MELHRLGCRLDALTTRAAAAFDASEESVSGMHFGRMTLDPISGEIVSGELGRFETGLFEADWAEAQARP